MNREGFGEDAVEDVMRWGESPECMDPREKRQRALRVASSVYIFYTAPREHRGAARSRQPPYAGTRMADPVPTPKGEIALNSPS